MRRILFLMGCLLLLTMPAAAQDGNIAITFPPLVYDVSGTVEVRGTVKPPNLQSYFLEAAVYDPANPSPQWIPVSLPGSVPVTDAVIAQWITTLLPDGVYQLRLHVLTTTGENLFAIVGPLRVANTLERPEGEQPIQLEPQVPATVAVPTAAAQAATEVPPPTAIPEPTDIPEPTRPPRPNPINDLPVPVGGQMEAFSDEAVEQMRAAGMVWIKWQIPFVIGDFSLITVADERIRWSHERGFKVLLSVKGERAELAANYGDDYYQQLAAFLSAISNSGPDAIEVWNEMNIDREWPTGQIDPADYVDMLSWAHGAIKNVDSDIMVITGALAPTGAEGAFGLGAVWNDDRYYLGMANAGVAEYADCIGVHYNEGIIPPSQQGGDPRDNYPTRFFPLMIQRAEFPFRASGLPLCFTELGYLSPEGLGPLPGGFAWGANTSVQEQATWLRDAIQIAGDSTSVIEMIIVFNMNGERYDEDPQAGYAIIRGDGTCLACQTIATLRQPGGSIG
ncbi:MAG: hypothetical protein H7175_26295 [Burkholderiales bacterium]|nr:hypothetical protein [Anaerolineae bacterium]